MHKIEATPHYLTRTLGMTKDEHDMLAIALEYTLQQVRYDGGRDRYFLKCYEPNGLTTVLEAVSFRVIDEAYGGVDL